MWNEAAALAIALFGLTAFLFLLKKAGVDTLSWGARLSLWGLAGATLLILANGVGGLWPVLETIGLAEPTGRSLLWGVIGAAGLMVAASLLAVVQRAAKLPMGDNDAFQRITTLPTPHRAFVVLTAAVVEETLFRGVALGVGSQLFGGMGAAVAVSVGAFTLAHLRWSTLHLAQVAVAGAGFCALFLLTDGDLWACIIAHLIVDGIGFLAVPALLRRRREGRVELRP